MSLSPSIVPEVFRLLVMFTIIFHIPQDVVAEESIPLQPLSPIPDFYSKDSDLVYSSGSVHSRIIAPSSLNYRAVGSFRSTLSFRSHVTSCSSEKEKPKHSR